MFKVYGVTIEVAKKKAEEKIKRMAKWEKPKTADEHEVLLKSISEDCFNDMKPVAIGKPFDAPQFAQEFIDLAKKTTRCRGMHIRIHAPKADSKGGVVLNQRTKKPAMQWVKYDTDTNYSLIIAAADAAKEKAISKSKQQ